jgi:hypothetical protein
VIRIGDAGMVTDRYKEAELLLHIYDLYSSDKMVDAFAWFFKEFQIRNLKDFEELYLLGSEGRRYFFKIGNFFDLLGTFVQGRYLPKKLVVDFCPDDVKSFWKTARKIVLQMRKKWNDPTLFTGIEYLNNETEKMQRAKKGRRRRRKKTKLEEIMYKK